MRRSAPGTLRPFAAILLGMGLAVGACTQAGATPSPTPAASPSPMMEESPSPMMEASPSPMMEADRGLTEARDARDVVTCAGRT